MGRARTSRTRRAQACRYAADAIVALVLVAAVASLGLAALALGEYVAWWLVAVPALAAAVLLWLFISAVTFVWVMRCRGSLLEGSPDEDGQFLESSLDTVLTVFKFCVAAHGYLSLVVLSLALGLVSALLDAPAGYWLVPVGLLGAAHLVTAALIKEPEVTPGLHGALGLCLLGHVVSFALKRGPLPELAWSLVFLPAWLTYAAVPFVAECPSLRAAQLRFGCFVAATVLAAAAQVMLTLRLDRVWTECPWSLVLSCALAAVILLLGAVGPGISRRTYTVLATVANARHDELSPRAASKQGLFDVESDSDRTLTPRIAA